MAVRFGCPTVTGLLIRHAPTVWNELGLWQGSETNPPLSPQGRFMAISHRRLLLNELDPSDHFELLASPLRRAEETARLLGGRVIDETLPLLVEMKAGPVAGMTRAEVEEFDQEFAQRWFGESAFALPSGGPSIAESIKRVEAALDNLAARTEYGWIAVTHLGVLRAAADTLGLAGLVGRALTGLKYADGDWTTWEPEMAPSRSPRVGLGFDHNGAPLVEPVRATLRELGFEIVEYNTSRDQEEIDYPLTAVEVATDVRYGQIDKAVLICGTGIGMALAANKVSGVRAATVGDTYSARRAALSNDAQILALGAEVIGPNVAQEIVRSWESASIDSVRSTRKLIQIGDTEATGGLGFQRGVTV